MKSVIALIFAAALLIAGAIIILTKDDPAPDEGPKSTQVHSQTSTSRSARPARPSSEKPFRFLKSLPSLPLSEAPGFAQVQARTKNLSIEQIQTLLAENTSHEGLSGWLRSALWAELGLRNHRKSFEKIIARLKGLEDNGASFASDQEIFAFLRGRTESLTAFDPSVSSLFEDLDTLISTKRTGHWHTRTYEHLFHKLALLDHATAWKLTQDHVLDLDTDLPGLITNSLSSKLAGFFSCLPTEELATGYIEKWQPALETPEVRKAYEIHQTQMNSRLSGFIMIPPEEAILKHALASLARFNPEAAVAWLAEHQVDPNKPDYYRIHGMWRELATQYPEQAFEIFSREEFVDARRSNASTLIRNDFSLAPGIIQKTEKSSHQAQILNSVISSGSSTHVYDFFPTPEGNNRLPDFQGRYKSLLEAINHGSYPERQREVLIRSLDRNFQKKLETE